MEEEESNNSSGVIAPIFGIIGVENSTVSYTTNVIIFLTIDTFIILLTVTGNILSICAIRLSKKLSAMLSNWFIFSLALSDLMVGLTVPYHLAFTIEIILGKLEGTCLLRFVLTILACSSSIMNLLVIATDRYIAIVYPLHYCRYMTKSVAIMLISASWVSCFGIATMPIYWNTWHEQQPCSIDEVLPDTYFNFLLTPLFLSIWLAMLLLYYRIWKEASDNAKRLKNSSGGQNYHNPALHESRSIQVVLIILCCFSISWLPYFTIITYNRIYGDNMPPYIYEAAFTLAVGNSCMNPLIYAWKNSNFREAFRCMLKCLSPRTLHRQVKYVTDHDPHGGKLVVSIKNGSANKGIDLENGSSKYLDHEQHSDITVTTSMHGSNILDNIEEIEVK